MRRLVTRLFPPHKGRRNPSPGSRRNPLKKPAAGSSSSNSDGNANANVNANANANANTNTNTNTTNSSAGHSYATPNPIAAAAAVVSLQFMSDLHLDVGPQYASFDFPVTAPYLVLAGDIGCLAHYDAYLGFLRRQTDRYARVFLVLGNREFYGLDFASGLAAAQSIEDHPSLAGRLCLLQQTRAHVALAGRAVLTILGCTLWSSVPPERSRVVAASVADFRHIRDWIVDDHNDAHAADLRWLRAELDKAAAAADHDGQDGHQDGPPPPVLVVTHHAPLVHPASTPEHRDDPWDSAFASHVLAVGDWRLVKSWIHGHTHYSCDFQSAGIRLVSNQRGRLPLGPSSSTDDHGQDFDPSKVLDVST